MIRAALCRASPAQPVVRLQDVSELLIRISLPEDLAAPLRAAFPGLSQRLHSGADLAPEMVSRLPDRPGARLPLRP